MRGASLAVLPRFTCPIEIMKGVFQVEWLNLWNPINNCPSRVTHDKRASYRLAAVHDILPWDHTSVSLAYYPESPKGSPESRQTMRDKHSCRAPPKQHCATRASFLPSGCI
jgi:hypothetical protein